MRAIRTTPPAFEAVTLEELKAHCRVDFSDEDSLLSGLLAGAIAYVDGIEGIGFHLARQSWQIYFSSYVLACLQLRLPIRPLISLDKVEYLDEAGAWQEIAMANFRVSSAGYPVLLRRASVGFLPAIPAGIDRVRISLTSGHAPAVSGAANGNIPADIRAGIKMLAAHWYRNPEAYSDRAQFEVPLGCSAIFAKYAANLVG